MFGFHVGIDSLVEVASNKIVSNCIICFGIVSMARFLPNVKPFKSILGAFYVASSSVESQSNLTKTLWQEGGEVLLGDFVKVDEKLKNIIEE